MENFELLKEVARTLERTIIEYELDYSSRHRRIGETNYYVKITDEGVTDGYINEYYTLSVLVDNEHEVVVKIPTKYYGIDVACQW